MFAKFVTIFVFLVVCFVINISIVLSLQFGFLCSIVFFISMINLALLIKSGYHLFRVYFYISLRKFVNDITKILFDPKKFSKLINSSISGEIKDDSVVVENKTMDGSCGGGDP